MNSQRFIIRCNRLVTVSWKTLPLVSCHSVFKSHYESFQIELTPRPAQTTHPKFENVCCNFFGLKVTPPPWDCSTRVFSETIFCSVPGGLPAYVSVIVIVFVLSFCFCSIPHHRDHRSLTRQGHLNNQLKNVSPGPPPLYVFSRQLRSDPRLPPSGKLGHQQCFFYQDSVTFLQGIL